MEKPLSGIRVLELADYVSAPVCCRLLADLGAEVIKIERSTGNVWRVTAQSYNPKRFTLDENPTYDIYNTGKKHIVLNLKTADGMNAAGLTALPIIMQKTVGKRPLVSAR